MGKNSDNAPHPTCRRQPDPPPKVHTGSTRPPRAETPIRKRKALKEKSAPSSTNGKAPSSGGSAPLRIRRGNRVTWKRHGDEQEQNLAADTAMTPIPETEEGTVEPADRTEVDATVTVKIFVPADIEMAVMPEVVRVVEEISAQEDPATSADPTDEPQIRRTAEPD